jgi:hypothetical protein
VQITKGPVWVVVRIDMTGDAGPQRTYMWIDPSPAATPDTNAAAVKRNSTFPNGFDTIALEFGGDGPNVRLIFDEIRLDTSFAHLSSMTLVGTYAARESFTYSHTTIAGLGAATNGFGGPWVVDPTDNGIGGLVAIGGTRFSYADLSWTIPYDTTHLQVIKSGAWSDHNRYKRPLAAAWPNVAGKKYWVSYLLDVKEPLPVGNTYFMVKLYEGTNERVAIGKGGGRDANPPVFTCGSGWPGASGDDVSSVQIMAGPVWIVARIDMTGDAGPQRTYMWIDPNPAAAPDTTIAVVKRNSTFPNGFDTIALEFGGDGPDVRLVFDEIRIATSFAGLSTGVPSTGINIPAQFALSQNYPNPFNPSTKINYTLAKACQVRLAVYDLLGREVAVLVNSLQNAGNHEVTFANDKLTSGVYFYRLLSDRESVTRKMVLMK